MTAIQEPVYGSETVTPKYDASYFAIHKWIRANYPRKYACERCGETRDLHMANRDHKYSLELSDWMELCRKCHCKHDGETGLRDYYQYSRENPHSPATMCSNGHEWNKENTYIWMQGDKIRRRCRTCSRINTANRRLRKRHA